MTPPAVAPAVDNDMGTIEPDARPCPWCGGQPRIVPWPLRGPRKRMILCRNDDCDVGPQVFGSTRLQALQKWNSRHE